jgi:hypothetical protein
MWIAHKGILILTLLYIGGTKNGKKYYERAAFTIHWI